MLHLQNVHNGKRVCNQCIVRYYIKNSRPHGAVLLSEQSIMYPWVVHISRYSTCIPAFTPIKILWSEYYENITVSVNIPRWFYFLMCNFVPIICV